MSNAIWKCSSPACYNVSRNSKSAIWDLHLPLCMCVSMVLGLGAVGRGFPSAWQCPSLLLWGMQMCCYHVTCHLSPVGRFCTWSQNQRQPWPLVLFFSQSLWAIFLCIGKTILLPFTTKFLTNQKTSLLLLSHHSVPPQKRMPLLSLHI